MHGLKIRQLISPVYPHTLPPFNRWVEREAAARFPNDYENWSSRLGIVGTLGFLAIVLLLFLPEAPLRELPLVRGASRLTLAVLLLATVGGFGAVFNLAVSPDIRAYNRMSPFIAFFSLLAVATAIDRMFKTHARAHHRRHRRPDPRHHRSGAGDREVNERTGGIAAEVAGLRGLAGTLERALPDGAMVFQLPVPYLYERERLRAHEADRPLQALPRLGDAPLQLSRLLERTGAVAAGGDWRGCFERSQRDSPHEAFPRFWSIATDMRTKRPRSSRGLKGVAGDDRVILSTDRFFAVHIDSPAGGRPADPIRGGRADAVDDRLSSACIAGADGEVRGPGRPDRVEPVALRRRLPR